MIQREGATLPPLWYLEITNGFGLAERRGRIDQAGMSEAMRLLRSLSPEVDEPTSLARCEVVLQLMREHRLTAYDATYLELAYRRGPPLATLDKALRQAASAVGVALLEVSA